MNTELFEIFSEKQIIVIKDIITTGNWGDSDEIEFNGNVSYAYGYETNNTKGLYKGRVLSGICSGIAKKIESEGSPVIKMVSDFWGDGSGDMMFFNMSALDASTKDLWNWAQL